MRKRARAPVLINRDAAAQCRHRRRQQLLLAASRLSALHAALLLPLPACSLDFVKGFHGSHVKDYLEASKPEFVVGERPS